ncbi:MAG: hypothetical protein EXR49_07510 [Dehalococcoidia bacterium]|nr:hypothetical protein [Dehalococcoidia bacterium]
MESPVLFVVFCVPHAGKEEHFNRWMDEVHVPDSAGPGKVFTRCFRYVALGQRERLYLHLWESAAADLESAMADVKAHAMRLKDRGRIEQPFTVVWSQWLAAAGATTPAPQTAVRSLVTLQNNWRDATVGESIAAWAGKTGLGEAGRAGQAPATYIYGSGSASGGEGKFLSLVESEETPEQAAARWRAAGEPGPCPFAPYKTIFQQQVWEQGKERAAAAGQGPGARVWVTAWEPYRAA